MNLLNIITSPTSEEMTKSRPISGLKPWRLFQAAKLAIFSGFSDTATIIFHYCMEKDRDKDRKNRCAKIHHLTHRPFITQILTHCHLI